MGILADSLAATLDAMRAADQRQAAETAASLASLRETIATLGTDPAPADAIADAVALLESHGYRITPPA
jgi:predicted CoA-binding protein